MKKFFILLAERSKFAGDTIDGSLRRFETSEIAGIARDARFSNEKRRFLSRRRRCASMKLSSERRRVSVVGATSENSPASVLKIIVRGGQESCLPLRYVRQRVSLVVKCAISKSIRKNVSA